MTALLIDEAHSLLTTVFLLAECFELNSRQRVKGMGNLESLLRYSKNVCSLTPLLSACATIFVQTSGTG